MTKNLFVYAAAASLAVATMLTPTTAQADNSGAVAAGVLGGLAVGTMIGSAATRNNGPYYRPAPAYYGSGYYGSGYYGSGYYGAGYYGPSYSDCYWQRQRVWDGYGWRLGRVRVCN
jgi:hypothetical protein